MRSSGKKVLYIQHASSLGGSCMSLLYTMQGLDKARYRPILALANNAEPVVELYGSAGFETITCPEITLWNHCTALDRPLYRISTWSDLLRVAQSWKVSQRKTLELVSSVKPDLVHLNSVTLSASVVALARNQIPFIWHIREHPPAGVCGARTRVIRHWMLDCPDELIFLSEADRQAWVHGERGEVVPNFIDFEQFDRSIDGAHVRGKLGIPADASVVLYVGGLRRLKGVFSLLRALSVLKERLPQLRCLMPGSTYNPPENWELNLARTILPLVGSGTVGQRVDRDIARLGLSETCIRLPFQNKIAPLIAASDVLVFPAIRPHFARPIVEASAMAKPVVASQLDGIEELVQDGKTGMVVSPSEPEELARGLLEVLTNGNRANQMGEAGYVYAREKFSADYGCSRIMEIYDRVLAGR